MDLQVKSNKVTELRSRFVDFLKSKPEPSAEDYEALQKIDVDLKAAESDYERAAAAQARQEEIERKFAAEREEIEIGIRRPALAPQVEQKKAPDDDVSYDEPLSISRPYALSSLFFSSPAYKAMARASSWPSDSQRFEVKATRRQVISSKAAGDPITTTNFNVIRTETELAEHFFVRSSVYDMVPKVAANASTIRVLRATPLTGTPAAPVSEGGTKPEAQPRWAPVDIPLETIAVWTAVTVQALADVPALRTLIDNDLRAMVLDETEDQIINGNGTPPNLRGLILQATPTAISGDTISATSAAITQMQSTGAGDPTVIILNPTDWQAVRTYGGPMGMYYWGPPTEAGTPRMWGVPVITTPRIAAGSGLVADMRFVTFFQSMGITFIVGWKNDDIIKNLQTIVCELRGALVVRRPEAVIKLTVTAPVAVLKTQTVP